MKSMELQPTHRNLMKTLLEDTSVQGLLYIKSIETAYGRWLL